MSFGKVHTRVGEPRMGGAHQMLGTGGTHSAQSQSQDATSDGDHPKLPNLIELSGIQTQKGK